MTRLITASMTSKAQLTLPKQVRDILHVGSKGDLIGFIIDTESKSVRLTRAEAVPMDPEFSPEEYAALERLRLSKKGRAFKSMSALLKDLKD